MTGVPVPTSLTSTVAAHECCRRAAVLLRRHTRPDEHVVVDARAVAAITGVLEVCETGDEQRMHEAVTRLAGALLADPPRPVASGPDAAPA